jgi:regulator of sirC expression with transglutaminase-like and TPR domain
MLPAESEPDLEGGVFLLVKVGYPDFDPKPYLKRLDALAERIRPKLIAAQGTLPKLSVMNRFLFQEERFRGNWVDYFDPQNSYLNRVLDRKLGIPISLSVLYLLLAKRLFFEGICGVGIPGHFMLKYKDPDQELFIDPFSEGRFLTRAECVQFVVEAGYPYQVEFLEGVGAREILARMLRSLILIYLDRHEPTLGQTLTRLLDLLDV